MNELIDKINIVKENLDKTKEVKNIKELNKELNNHKDLIELINKYNLTQDVKLKEEIISNSFFKKYKLAENDINYIILNINSKLKKISKKGICSK